MCENDKANSRNILSLDDSQLDAELINEYLENQNKLKETQISLTNIQDRYKALTQTSIDGFFILDSKGHFLEVNDAYCTMSGYSKNELLAMSIKDMELDEDEKQMEEHISRIIETGQDQLESRHRKADGTVFYVNNSITYIPKEEILICFLHDITEWKKQEERLKYLSYHDILTGLYNRTFFEEEIKRLDVNRQLPLAVIMGDINGLKLINDSFGHEIGDQTIIEVANIIKSCCREEDIIARVGGDEFCILLPKSDENVIQRICQQMYDKCIQQDRKIKGVSILYSISLGYTKRTVAHEQIEMIMKDAEAAMYRHKLLETRRFRSSFVSSIISTLKERYIETEAHSERLKKLCRAIGVDLGVSDAMLDDLELLSALHDIGKIAVSDAIINKQSELTDDEKIEMRRHTAIGYNITQSTIEFQQISEYILDHHEKWDGSGYPRQLKGEEIPLLSRIISVVDSYDAMITGRPYRKALSEEYAINEIRACAGTQFDPIIARVFVEKVLGKVW